MKMNRWSLSVCLLLCPQLSSPISYMIIPLLAGSSSLHSLLLRFPLLLPCLASLPLLKGIVALNWQYAAVALRHGRALRLQNAIFF